MQRETIIRLLNTRNALLKDYASKKAKYDEVFASAASASISAGGGSKSYTNHQLSALRAELDAIERRIARITRRLSGGNSSNIRHVVTIRS